MNKKRKTGIGALSDGIAGFYRTKRYKIKILAIILAITLLVSGVLLACLIKDRAWDGRVYVMPSANAFYEVLFYKKSDTVAFLKERGIDRADFERTARVTALPRGTLTEEKLADAGLSGFGLPLEEIKGYGTLDYYFVIIDGDGKCIYQGTDIAAFFDALRGSGF